MTPKTDNKTDNKINNQTTNPTTAQTAQATQPERPSDHPNLSYLYGSIGIQAVAAAARYSDVRAKPVAQQIDQRFVESAV
jgi:hypothetical protein